MAQAAWVSGGGWLRCRGDAGLGGAEGMSGRATHTHPRGPVSFPEISMSESWKVLFAISVTAATGIAAYFAIRFVVGIHG